LRERVACEDERGAVPFTAFWVLGVDEGTGRLLVMTVSFSSREKNGGFPRFKTRRAR